MKKCLALTIVLAAAFVAAAPARAQHKSYYYRPVTRDGYTHTSTSKVYIRDENEDGIDDRKQRKHRD